MKKESFKDWRSRKMREQKIRGILGVILGLISMPVLQDATLAVLIVPMAVWLIVTKEVSIF